MSYLCESTERWGEVLESSRRRDARLVRPLKIRNLKTDAPTVRPYIQPSFVVLRHLAESEALLPLVF